MAVTDDAEDFESPRFYQREYRYLENTKLRNAAREECPRLNRGRIEHQLFSVRTPQTPAVLYFHPYHSHLAVAGKDSFSVWDYLTNSKLCYWRVDRGGSGSLARNAPRITALDIVNAHDSYSLLVTGSEDGTIRLWANYAGTGVSREPQLVTAWQALSDGPLSRSSHSTGSGSDRGLVMTWDQSNQNLLVAGDSRVIRVWDAERELRVCDYPSGADSNITCLDYDHSGSSLMVAGFADGAVCLFDRRMPVNDAKVTTYREHSKAVTCVNLRGDGGSTLLTGSGGGDVRVTDTRKHSSVFSCQTAQGMTAMAAHRMADIFACGAVQQYIGIYSLNGTQLTAIKYHEWFMASHFVPVTTLAFHPLRSHMAAGSLDTSITVYSVDPKR